MAIDVTEIVAQFGAYYKEGSTAQQNLRGMLYQPGETAAFFQPRPTNDTRYEGSMASLNRIVQPFQKAFTPVATLKFKPNVFPLFKLKIDISETPDELESTYLGFLAALPTQDRAQWPFVRWFLENHVIPRTDADMEENEYFLGEYDAPDAGVAGAAGTAMDGIRKNIRGYNTAGRLNLGNGPIATGALAADDVDLCTQIEEWVNGIPKIFRRRLDYVFMNDDIALRFKRGKRKKYNQHYTQEADLLTIADHPRIKVQGLASHGDSELIWATLPENRINPIKKGGLKNTFKVESAKRNVDIYTDWHEALNFEVPEFIFTNDRDLA